MERNAEARLAQFTALRQRTFYPKTDLPMADAELRELRNRPDSDFGLSFEHVRAAAAAAFPSANPVLRPLERQGTFHRLYLAELPDGRRFVLRFNITAAGWGGQTLHLEEWAVRTARAAGVPAPAILLTDTSRRLCPFDFQAMAWIGDRSLQEFDEEEAEMQRLLGLLGTVLARLHTVPAQRFGWLDLRPLRAEPRREPAGLFAGWPDYLTLQLENHVEACRRMGALAPEPAKRVLDHFQTLAPQLSGFQPALLHGDPGSHNAATNGREISALLDWEDSLAGDPVYEIAFWATFHPERRHAAFLQGYRAVRTLPDDFDVRFWLYFLRVALAKTVHRQRFGYVDRPGRPPAAQRIQTALERLEAALAPHS